MDQEQKQLRRVSRVLHHACRQRLKDGWKIISGGFGVPSLKTCCPIAATGVDLSYGRFLETWGKRYDITTGQVWSIIHGFDTPHANPKCDAWGNDSEWQPQWVALGQRLRKFLS